MMCTTKFRVESGVQMLLRLTRKTDFDNFYPNLFKMGPKLGHTIEIYSEDDTSCLLYDIISESMIPLELGGKECGVIIFNTDGNFNLGNMENIIKCKLAGRLCDLSLLNEHVHKTLQNMFLLEIYNATQFYITIQNLEGILLKHPNVSLIVFHTLTAFYWSEQSFKLMKMDIYSKYLLTVIKKAVKDFKIVTLYTRPQYFSSSKENIENLEACTEYPSLEHLNYRVHVVFTEDGTHQTTVRTYNDLYKGSFRIQDSNIVWC